jgi:hypothetical protein
MDKNQINVINEIPQFKYALREWRVKDIKSQNLIGVDNMSNYRTDAVLIFYTPQKEYVELCIYWNLSIGTKVLGLHWENFNKQELKEIAETFKLQIVVNRDGNYYLNVQNYANYSATLCIKKSEQADSYFIAIYYYDDGESRRNPELYVHGVWEITLSEELCKKIF